MPQHLDAFVCIPLPEALVAEVMARKLGVSSLIEQLVSDFLERTEEDFLADLSKPTGVYWESLFLPTGTQVRTKYFGEYKVATIEGELIVWDGVMFSSFAHSPTRCAAIR